MESELSNVDAHVVDKLLMLGGVLQKHKEPIPFNLGTDPRKCHWLIDGKLETFDVSPDCRNVTVYSLDDLVTAVRTWGRGRVTVWIGNERATVHLNDADRRDVVRLEWTTTPEWAYLEDGDRMLPQTDFIARLRRELRHAEHQAAVLAAVRNVRWATSEVVTASAQLGRGESIGAQVERSIAGVESLDKAFPDTLLLALFCTEEFRALVNSGRAASPGFVTLLIEPVISQKMFRVGVLPGELEWARARQFGAIADHLAEQLQAAPASTAPAEQPVPVTILRGEPDWDAN